MKAMLDGATLLGITLAGGCESSTGSASAVSSDASSSSAFTSSSTADVSFLVISASVGSAPAYSRFSAGHRYRTSNQRCLTVVYAVRTSGNSREDWEASPITEVMLATFGGQVGFD